MSRLLRVDWPLLVNRFEAFGIDPNASCLVCIPTAGVYLLAAIVERLQWRATYDTGEYDYGDWIDLQEIVEDTINGLNPMCDDLITAIVSQVTTNMSTIIQNSVIYNDVCCMTDAGNPIADPDPIADPPAATADLCKQAQAAHDNGLEFLNSFLDTVDVGSGITAGLIATLIGGFFILPVALLGALVGALVAILSDALTDELLETWEDLKHAIVCAIVEANSADNAKNAVHGIIDASDASAPVKAVMKLIYNQAQVNKIWLLEYDSAGYDSDYCEDCTPPTLGAVVGVGWTVTSYFSSQGNQALGGISWREGESNMDLINQDGSLDNDPPAVEGTYALVPPGFTGGSVATHQYEHADPDPSVYNAQIGFFSRSSDPKTFTITMNNFRLLRELVSGGYAWDNDNVVSTATLPANFSFAGGTLTINGTFTGSFGGTHFYATMIFTPS